MEKWKISPETDSAMSGMDISQISELATAIMDSWSSASPSDIVNNPQQNLSLQSPSETIPKGFTIKQEPLSGFDITGVGVLPIQGYFQSHQQGNVTPDVPMDDPLESFSFWDGENFYCTDAVDIPMDSGLMPPLPEEYDDMSREDDPFTIKDFVHNPTLAELNSCGETVFDYSVNTFITEDSSYLLSDSGLSKSFPASESHFVASPGSIPNSTFSSGLNYIPSGFIDIHKQNIQSSLSSSCPPSSRLVPSSSQPPQFLTDKLPLCPQNSPASDSYFGPRLIESKVQVPLNTSRITSPPLLGNRLQDSSLLSSSAPPDVTMSSYFGAKIKSEPPSSSPGPRSTTERSLSGFSSLSLSNDDESGSFFDDDDEDEDFSSDDADLNCQGLPKVARPVGNRLVSLCMRLISKRDSNSEDVCQYESDDLSTSWPGKEEKSCQHRKHRFFWQYNLQSRGAKTQNILPQRRTADPHILNDAFDPVFSEECSLPVKHSGKARRGDGNDLTPDPRKLYNIGMELRKLNKLIYSPSEGGSHGKPLSRKEKNKLASRVCRLKKKAQHEANKLKLYGLQQEHKKLLSILVDTRELLRYKIENLNDHKVSNCSQKLETFLATNEPFKVAGNTSGFVNEVLDKIAKGEMDGGLGRL